LLKDFLQKEYFPAQGAAATAATTPITNKRKRGSSKGKNIKSKRAKPDDSQKNAPIVENINDVPEQEAAAIAAPAVPVEQEATSSELRIACSDFAKQVSAASRNAPSSTRRLSQMSPSSSDVSAPDAVSVIDGILYVLDAGLRCETLQHDDRTFFADLRKLVASRAAPVDIMERSQSTATVVQAEES
jgi:hypothetical protein